MTRRRIPYPDDAYHDARPSFTLDAETVGARFSVYRLRFICRGGAGASLAAELRRIADAIDTGHPIPTVHDSTTASDSNRVWVTGPDGKPV